MEELKKVEVIWLDAAYDGDEHTKKDMADFHPIPRRHVGYLLRDDDKEVILSCGITERSKITDDRSVEDTYELSFALPRGIIKEIRILND